ncbi:hypothetical protein [Blastococcus atacamensis]|uniref:hypothetical protein n=1 Tax=Blastococcus atacamensis TaxID=2070508 RepID=UPI000CEC2ABA|nr:hypothetical protein [Blastococcus atacamensis]
MSIRRRTVEGGLAVKVVATLVVMGSAAAIAGLGTFGAFTSSTTPVDQSVQSGVLSIALDGVNASPALPISIDGLQPGTSSSVPLDVRNAGTVGWATVTFDSWATVSSRLDTDTANGLQLGLRSCSEPWTPAGDGAYTCGGTVIDLYAGPIVTTTGLAGVANLHAGQVDHLLLTTALPRGAGNTLKGLSSELEFILTATQRAGAAR